MERAYYDSVISSADSKSLVDWSLMRSRSINVTKKTVCDIEIELIDVEVFRDGVNVANLFNDAFVYDFCRTQIGTYC